MERLTKKNETNSLGYSQEKITQIICKLSKLEDLEEQIDCPLEVRCRLYYGVKVFTNDKKVEVISISQKGG